METTRKDAENLEQAAALMVQTARAMQITDNDGYERGNEFLKEIKTRAKAVKEYWKGPKAAAQAAHKELVAKESQMLKPLEDAEKIIKKAMLDYTAEVERKRREAEEAARKARDEEIKRLESIAAEAERKGDSDTAEFMRDMAGEVTVEEVSYAPAPAANGTYVRAVWKARVTDPNLVPAYYGGFELRTVNMSALNSLARFSNGGAQVPGVEFYRESTLTVRT